jgi:hypothetical protein
MDAGVKTRGTIAETSEAGSRSQPTQEIGAPTGKSPALGRRLPDRRSGHCGRGGSDGALGGVQGLGVVVPEPFPVAAVPPKSPGKGGIRAAIGLPELWYRCFCAARSMACCSRVNCEAASCWGWETAGEVVPKAGMATPPTEAGIASPEAGETAAPLGMGRRIGRGKLPGFPAGMGGFAPGAGTNPAGRPPAPGTGGGTPTTLTPSLSKSRVVMVP